MELLAHRGMWCHEEEKNTLSAIEKAFAEGFGIETDIRDRNGELVISHNPADQNAPKLTDVLNIWSQYSPGAMLALNVKADGLYLLFKDIFNEYRVGRNDYFLFDASVPEEYVYRKRGYVIYTRSSEFERTPVFMDESPGIWLDQFTDCEHIENQLEKLLDEGKKVAVVSPELHGRDPDKVWRFLKRFRDNKNILLCTDCPCEARDFLYGKD